MSIFGVPTVQPTALPSRPCTPRRPDHPEFGSAVDCTRHPRLCTPKAGSWVHASRSTRPTSRTAFDPGVTPSQPHGVDRIRNDCRRGHLGQERSLHSLEADAEPCESRTKATLFIALTFKLAASSSPSPLAGTSFAKMRRYDRGIASDEEAETFWSIQLSTTLHSHKTYY
jgi:hypothetical protein